MRLSACTSGRPDRIPALWPLVGALVITSLFAGRLSAGEPVFEQVLPAMRTTALLEHESKVLRGLDGGGIIVWDRFDQVATERWTSGKDLSGNYITDMAWTGQNIWIATLGAGLTRVNNLDTAPEFRQYANNLGSLDVTAVTGTIIGGGERVFYGMDGQGVGQINSGLSGNIYTAEQDGLISDFISALAMYQGDLFVGTPFGISRFANNVFTDQNAGLGSLVINDMLLDDTGNLLAANNAGIYQWDSAGETWFQIGDLGTEVVALASSAGLVYALGVNSFGSAVLGEYDGNSWSPIASPYRECTAIAAGEEFWVAGPVEEITAGGKLTYNYLGRRLAGDEFDSTVGITTQVANCEGVAFGADDSVWMGDLHGFQISNFDPSDKSNLFIYEIPHAGNDTLNLFPGRGPVLSIVGAEDGRIYAGQYAGGGVLQYDPATMTTELMDPANSGLLGRNIVNLVAHPDGPLIVLHDKWGDAQRVEVLVDPDNWSGTGNWFLPPMEEGFGDNASVWDALVEKKDIIWFAVEDVGLIRWDVNGPDAGPDDPLTWFDESDDVWYDPMTSFTGSTLKPGKALGLALGRDGTLWAGGNGLVQFDYEIVGGTALADTVWLDLQEKGSASGIGLVNGNVKDIAVDGNGDVWVATTTGLNRVTPRGKDTLVSAWIDLPNYLANPTYGVLYSPNVIAPLPGLTYAKIAPSRSGRNMLLSSDQGTTLITVGSGPASGQEGDPLEDVYCYPNPWTPGEQAAQLSLGGLPVETVRVDIYNVEGQVLFRDYSVYEDVGFWNGENNLFSGGGMVASGLYVVRITAGDLTTTRVVAVVR